MKLLENKIDNSKLKLKKDYIEKLSLLLHDSFKYKNYSFKRNNINNIIYKYNNNELRLTFKKGRKNNNDNTNSYYNDENFKSNLILTPNISKINLIEDEVKNNKNEINDLNNNKNCNFLEVSDDVRKILYNNNNEEISLNEQRKIYNKFKNKYPYFRNKLINQLNCPLFNSEKINKYKHLDERIIFKNPKLKIRLIKNNSPLEQLLKTANELRNLRDKHKINKKSLSEDNLLKEIKKESIYTPPHKEIKKKLILSPHELFYYDAKKWKNNRNTKKDGKDEKYFKNIDKQIDDTIKEMKNKVILLNEEIVKLEEVKNKMKSHKKLIAVKSKTFKNFKSQFLSSEDRKKFVRQNSKINY